ncbi:hypothetical protein PG994_003780 [Apiospora phragmitis]|uniref:Uncharacterized protein n=1 Tax=Apiospora phragmitis TaxID=2905665 RepID=A0ABR1VZ72_9PEZI
MIHCEDVVKAAVADQFLEQVLAEVGQREMVGKQFAGGQGGVEHFFEPLREPPLDLIRMYK